MKEVKFERGVSDYKSYPKDSPRDTSGEYSVVFTGFKTLEEAKEFESWYDGQGEQDAYIWMCEHSPNSYWTSGKRTVNKEDKAVISYLYPSSTERK